MPHSDRLRKIALGLSRVRKAHGQDCATISRRKKNDVPTRNVYENKRAVTSDKWRVASERMSEGQHLNRANDSGS